ncbi:MAG: transposase [Planctomycetes bacterium]|nr:transposase [Planctomycetota bacterium]
MSTRRSRADWRRLLSRQAHSGLSIAEFCRREGVRPQSLSWWRWKLRTAEEQAADRAPNEPRFLELELTGASVADSGVAFEIALPGDVVVRVPRGFDPRELERLVRAVRSSC